jgi:cyclase
MRKTGYAARWSRRELVTAAAMAAAGLLPRFARPQRSSEPLELTELGDGLFLLTGAGANIVIEAGGDGLVLVDDGLAERADDLVRLLAERWPGRPVDVVFNTNWRPEHTGANAALVAAGARILAHENTKLWLAGDFFVKWENRRYHPQPPASLPTQTFYESGTVAAAGGEIEYRFLPRAHTDGDICVFLPQRNVLAVSDLLAVGSYPVPDYVTGGWIGGFEDATRALLEIADADTRIVPAVGGVCGRMDLEAQLELCTTVRERVAEAFRHGMSFEDFTASAPTREFDAERGDPSRFLELVYEGAWAHVRELRGVI